MKKLLEHNPFIKEVLADISPEGHSVEECRDYYRQLLGNLTHLQDDPLFVLNNALTHNIDTLGKRLPIENPEKSLIPEEGTPAVWKKFRGDIVVRLTAIMIIVQRYPAQIPSAFSSLALMASVLRSFLDNKPEEPEHPEEYTEAAEISDVITKIAEGCYKKMLPGASVSHQMYIFSSRVDFLGNLLQNFSTAFEPLFVDFRGTPKNIENDSRIAEFITTIIRNKHTEIVLSHPFQKKSKFINAFLTLLAKRATAEGV